MAPVAPIGIGLFEDHNAGVAAVREGRVLLYCEYERVTRIKNQGGWLPEIVARLLRELPLDEVGAFCTPTPQSLVTLLSNEFGAVAEPMDVVRLGDHRIPVHGQADMHPLLHFLAALPLRAVQPGVYAVLIFDAEQPRLGWVNLSHSLSAAPDLHLRTLSTNRWFNGEIFAGLFGKLFYGSGALSNCGKLMGLASWGQTRIRDLRWVRQLAERHFNPQVLTWQGYGHVDADQLAAEARETLGVDARRHDEVGALDLAAAAQELFCGELTQQVESGIGHVRREIEEAGLPPPRALIYGGGCALSVVTNALIREVVDLPLLIPPYAHDASQFVGAAVWASLKCTAGDWRLGRGWDGVPSHTVGRVSARQLKARDLPMRPADPVEIARRLLSGQLIAWVGEGAEAGPRALGHRSLLANALDPNMRSRINDHVKRREWYRPFAPAVIGEEFPRYFGGRATEAAAFMLDAFRVTPEHRTLLSSVMSPDGCARAQAVDARNNPRLHDLLTAVGSLSGHPLLLNTSLNAPGLTIALDLDQVLGDCRLLRLDAAVIDGMLVEREALGCASAESASSAA